MQVNNIIYIQLDFHIMCCITNGAYFPSLCWIALYARISVQCNQCKLRYQKSSAVARCPITVFNEVFMFSLPELPLQQCKIWISVYETHTRKSTKHLIGELSLGKEKNSEDDHWTLMMHSLRQPIAKWHDLLIWQAFCKSSTTHALCLYLFVSI